MHQRAKSKSVCEADGKADLDLLEAHVEQQLEHARLAVMAHRVDQRLVAVAQVDRAPDRRLFDALGRPGAVMEPDEADRVDICAPALGMPFGSNGWFISASTIFRCAKFILHISRRLGRHRRATSSASKLSQSVWCV
jgi:hypothetical protein